MHYLSDMLEDIEAANQASRLKRYVRISIAIVLSALGLVWGLNIYADPTGAHQSGNMPTITGASRDIKVSLLHDADPDTSLLILGSSRSLQCRPEHVTTLGEKRKAFNAALYGAGPLDLHAMFGIATEQAKLPIKEVLVGLELSRFAPGQAPNEVMLGKPEMLAAIPPSIRPTTNVFKPFFSPLSEERFLLSLRAMRNEFFVGWPERKEVFLADGTSQNNDVLKKMKDGTLDLRKSIEARSKGYLRTLERFDQLDQGRVEHLRLLFDRLDEQEIKVSVYLTPLHPEVISALRANPRFDLRHQELVDILRHEAETRGYRFLDAMEISAFGGKANYFYDGSHTLSENMDLLLSHLFSLPHPKP